MQKSIDPNAYIATLRQQRNDALDALAASQAQLHSAESAQGQASAEILALREKLEEAAKAPPRPRHKRAG